MSSNDAFLLLSLPNCTIRTPTATQTGILALECVTLPPSAQATFGRDVFLVFKINELEIPIDPARTVSPNISTSNEREYVFHGTDTDPLVFTLTFNESLYSAGPLTEDMETFESVLSQYANFIQRSETPVTPPNAQQSTSVKDQGQDFRGRLLLRDEGTGEIVGEFDRKIVVREDPTLHQKGHESDPVVIEIPEDATSLGHQTAIEVFARNVPPDQHDWMTKSATLVSDAISGTTNLLVRVISSASSYYISHSTPSASAHSSTNSLPRTGTLATPSPTPPPPPPSRAAVFLSSERTRKGLTKVHAVSATAVNVSSKTTAFIDDMIGRIVGGKKDPQPPRQGAPPPSTNLAPPPYSSTPNLGLDGKPPLPPRGSRPSSPLPASPGGQTQGPALPPRELGTKARIVLSADLIFSTIEESTKKIITIGAERADAMIRHKFGHEVAQSSAAVTGTARNIGLVYIDLQGIGRKAIVKRVAKAYVKGRSSRK